MIRKNNETEEFSIKLNVDEMLISDSNSEQEENRNIF